MEALNEAWCTTFWSYTYDSFDQVESPSSLGEESIMALNLDWKRAAPASWGPEPILREKEKRNISVL